MSQIGIIDKNYRKNSDNLHKNRRGCMAEINMEKSIKNNKYLFSLEKQKSTIVINSHIPDFVTMRT